MQGVATTAMRRGIGEERQRRRRPRAVRTSTAPLGFRPRVSLLVVAEAAAPPPPRPAPVTPNPHTPAPCDDPDRLLGPALTAGLSAPRTARRGSCRRARARSSPRA